VMAALLLVGVARADETAKSTGQETKEAGQAAGHDTRNAAEQAGSWTKEQESKAEHAAGAMTKGEHDANMKHASSPAAQGERERMSKKDFDIKGKVAKVSKDSLTLNRDDATAATLHVDENTKIQVDGNTSKLADVKPGEDVKASFNLKGDKPVAIEIKADSKK